MVFRWFSSFFRFWRLEGGQDVPRRSKTRQDAPRTPPRRAKTPPRRPQDGAKTRPRRPKMPPEPPRTAKMTPKWSQVGIKIGHKIDVNFQKRFFFRNAYKTNEKSMIFSVSEVEVGSKNRSKIEVFRGISPETLPRCPKTPPRRPQDGAKTRPRRPKMPPKPPRTATMTPKSNQFGTKIA